jgi:hypothetical protein
MLETDHSYEQPHNIEGNLLPIGSVEDSIKWHFEDVYPDTVILHENIRPFDWEFIEDLAVNINEHGLLEACIGDVVLKDGVRTVRLLAGQHRAKAVRMLFECGEFTKLSIRVSNRTLTPEEIVEIQMSENLHNVMTPAQEAVIIAKLWKDLKEIHKDKITRKELAAKVGRSYEVVCNSIRYIEEIHPSVQQMVDEGIISYSVALTLLPIISSVNDKNNSWDKQLQYAIYFVTNDFTSDKARRYINGITQSEKFTNGSLFSPEEWEEMGEQARKINMKNRADKIGGDAVGWFKRMIRLAEILEDPYRILISKALVSRASDLGIALDQFYKVFPQYK